MHRPWRNIKQRDPRDDKEDRGILPGENRGSLVGKNRGLIEE